MAGVCNVLIVASQSKPNSSMLEAINTIFFTFQLSSRGNRLILKYWKWLYLSHTSCKYFFNFSPFAMDSSMIWLKTTYKSTFISTPLAPSASAMASLVVIFSWISCDRTFIPLLEQQDEQSTKICWDFPAGVALTSSRKLVNSAMKSARIFLFTAFQGRYYISNSLNLTDQFMRYLEMLSFYSTFFKRATINTLIRLAWK